jgi:hypothetical protein
VNKKNLIILGALCQKMFNLPNFFNVIELPSDFSGNTYRISQTEYIELTKLGISNNYETMYVGYSEQNDTLVIKE